MFCPKCGTKNPDNGKFCRSCGTDLGNVANALTGKKSKKNHSLGMIDPTESVQMLGKRGKPVRWDGAISTMFTGVAFLIIAAVLGITGIAGGKFWWFWMLIPAFGALGTGIAQIIQLKKMEKENSRIEADNSQNYFASSNANAQLPPNQTEYVSPESRYKTGDLVPPSVIENTTRHLEINKEGETMTLPQKK